MPAIPRKTILDKFRAMIAEGRPIIGGGAGTGLSAKAEEAGGIDLIVIYNSGRYRMAGRGSAAGLLAYGNANEIVREMAVEVLPVVRHTPVLAGVNGTDPFVLMPQFLAELKQMGFSGVQNFPTIGLFDGMMRQSFEETGMGFGLEVDMIAAAAESLDQCVGEIDAIASAATGVRSDVIVICHGGPIAMPDDARHILGNCRICHGFYGASSMERLPAEMAIRDQTATFKSLQLKQRG
jgi:predicted TIM-barrel enzyme